MLLHDWQKSITVACTSHFDIFGLLADHIFIHNVQNMVSQRQINEIPHVYEIYGKYPANLGFLGLVGVTARPFQFYLYYFVSLCVY